MMDYDSPWKEALDRYFPAFLACFFPRTHAGIDWTHDYESLDAELRKIAPDAETGTRHIDKLVKARRLDSAEPRLLHVEVQNQHETEFTHRIHVYNYRAEDVNARPVTTLVVLGDESPTWRPAEYVYEEDGCRRTLSWPVVKLLDYADRLEEIEAGPHLFMRLVVAHLVAQRTREDVLTRATWKLRLLRGLLTRNLEGEDVRQWMRYIDWLLVLPRTEEEEVTRQFQAAAGEKYMPYVTSWEQIGIEKGRIEELQQTIALALKAQFRQEGEALVATVRSCQNLTLLKQLRDNLVTGTTLDEVRNLLAGS
jgi:hypothetical protein